MARATKTTGRRSAENGARSRLVEQTAQHLSKEIMDGTYGPGDRIREPEVAERLGISRAPVREALRVLEHDGLIELTPWRGARVINPPPNEIADLFDLLAAVEGVVARLAVRHASDTELQRYARTVNEIMATSRRKHSTFELVDLAYAASGVLARSCGSTLATGMVRKLGKPAYWLHRFLLPAPARWQQQSITKQLKLREAIEARDEERAERAARQLVEHTKRLIVLRAQQVESARGILRALPGTAALNSAAAAASLRRTRSQAMPPAKRSKRNG